MADEVVLLIFDLALFPALNETRDKVRQGLLPIPGGDPGYDVEATLLLAMGAPVGVPFDLSHARYDRVCLVGDRLQRRRLLAVVARTIWPMVEAGRVFTCDMPYSRDRSAK